MGQLSNMDVIISLMFVVSMVVAFIRGFVKEVLSIIGLALFVILTITLSPYLTDWLKQFVKSEMMAKFVGFLLITGVFYAFWIIGTDKLISRIRTSTLSVMDRMFGIVFGFLRAVIVLGFLFLLTKIMLPEVLKEKDFKESKYFVIANTCSQFIEGILPEESIKKTLKSVEDMNKVNNKKEEKTEKKSDIKVKEVIKELPNKSDQEKMDKMFELLVKPELKKKANPKKENNIKQGYNKSDTSSLDKLIDEAI